MKHVCLGRSGLQVSQIALGTAQFWDPRNDESAIETIRMARDRGVSLFDTARSYGEGRSEQILGRALADDLRSRRGEVVIASKGGLGMTSHGPYRDASPAKLRRDVHESLVALGIDQIDLYQVHWPDPKIPVSETAGALGELVTEGKIGHVGYRTLKSKRLKSSECRCLLRRYNRRIIFWGETLRETYSRTPTRLAWG